MTYVKAKLALEEVAPGGRIDIKLAANEPIENVPRAVIDDGHKVIEIRQDGRDYHVIVEKAGAKAKT